MTNENTDKLLKKGLLGPQRPTLAPLRKRYKHPPFSVLNTRDGEWQKRKKAWIRLGIQSEVGRCENLLDISAQQAASMGVIDLDEPGAIEVWNKQRREMKQQTGRSASKSTRAYNDHQWMEDHGSRAPNHEASGTSIFDPTLTELLYTWFCPPGGIIVDPFAGGSVRGIVASVLGFKYWGCELRAEQVDANKAQLTDATRGKYRPIWKQGDSFDRLPKSPPANFLMSCPPYGNLEQYSDDPADLSAMEYPEFIVRYAEIIDRSVARLQPDSFAAFVVSNFRCRKTGRMHDFVGDTIRAFESAGAAFYNDIVLVNAVGTAAMRAKGNFDRGARKVVKVHQNVVVFFLGDPKKAAEKLLDL